MRDMDLLYDKLSKELGEMPKEKVLHYFLHEVNMFFIENMGLDNYEVSIFIPNKEKTILYFIYPLYLVDSGMIPVSSLDAVAAKIFRQVEVELDNNMEQHKHLTIFEVIKTPDNKIMPVWKLLGAPIIHNNETIGVLEITRRSEKQSECKRDFTIEDQFLLEAFIKKFSGLFKKVLPEDYVCNIT